MTTQETRHENANADQGKITFEQLGFPMETALEESAREMPQCPAHAGINISRNLAWAFGDRHDVPESVHFVEYFEDLMLSFCEVARVHGSGPSPALTALMDELKGALRHCFAEAEVQRVLAVLP